MTIPSPEQRDYTSIFRLDGRKVVVVGGGSGLGRASSIALAQFGATVVVADVNPAGAEETLRTLTAQGLKAEAVALDVTDTPQVEAVAAANADAEVLVATPGINVRKQVLDTTDDELERVLDMNLKGAYRLARAFGPRMAQRGKGSIINFSSFRAPSLSPARAFMPQPRPVSSS